jgi:hypothetical protein
MTDGKAECSFMFYSTEVVLKTKSSPTSGFGKELIEPADKYATVVPTVLYT